jgi:predicted phosphodiesterase
VRVAALYDVHGNLPALEAALADPRCVAADAIVAGGDVVWGPLPVECVRLLRDAGARFLAGNCERDVLAGVTEIGWWCRAQLDDEVRAEVEGWAATVTLDVDGLGSVLFCHGSPRSDDEILTRLTPDAAVEEACGGAPIVVGGHTHVQFDRTAGPTRLVNAGSVGMPYEGRTAAFWALLGPGVELVSTDYDVGAAAAVVLATGYPGASDLAETMHTPHSAEEASQIFEARRQAGLGA